jgi:hypothetical protein
MTGFWGSARFCGTNCGRDLGTKKSVNFSPIYLHASPKETDEKSVIFAEENMTALLVLPFIPSRYPVRAACITIRSQPSRDGFYSRSRERPIDELIRPRRIRRTFYRVGEGGRASILTIIRKTRGGKIRRRAPPRLPTGRQVRTTREKECGRAGGGTTKPPARAVQTEHTWSSSEDFC